MVIFRKILLSLQTEWKSVKTKDHIIMKKYSLLVLLMMLLGVLPTVAQIRGSNIQVTVVPDHQDWRYEVGHTATFKVSVTQSNTLMSDVTIDYAAGPEMYQDVKKQGVVLKDGTLTLKGKMTKPGFYRVDVTARVGGKEYKGACGAAFSPEKLQPTTVMPKDFSDYWQHAIQEARKVDLNPTKRLLPERCTKDVNVYEVSFQNLQWDWRTYGVLCVPVKEGSIPPCCVFPVPVSVPMAVTSIRRHRVPSRWRSASTASVSRWIRRCMTTCSTVP